MLDKAKSVFNALTKARSVVSFISDGLNDVRLEIERLKQQREDILSMPVVQSIAVDRALWDLHKCIADARQKIGNPAQFSVSPDLWTQRWRGTPDLSALVVAYLAPQMIAAVTDEVQQVYEGGLEGISDQERQKLLDENEQETLDAELAEESIIRQAEEQGMVIDRRIDADPRAVLADESALP